MLCQFHIHTRKGNAMKNVTMYFALALVFVLGTDAVYGQESKQGTLTKYEGFVDEAKKYKNYWEQIQETRRVFGIASEALPTKKQLEFLAVCQKAREAGVINYACGSFRDDV